MGLLLSVVVHPADVQDRDGAFQLLRRARRSGKWLTFSNDKVPGITDAFLNRLPSPYTRVDATFVGFGLGKCTDKDLPNTCVKDLKKRWRGLDWTRYANLSRLRSSRRRPGSLIASASNTGFRGVQKLGTYTA